MTCSWVVKEGGRLWGGGLRGARCACLLPTEGESAGPSTFASVFCAFVVSVIILIHFVVVIFSLRMYAQQVFSPLFTGVLNTTACICRGGASGVFPAGLRLAFVSSVRDSFGHGKCLPIFYRGLMCMCCVCVYAHARTLHVGYSDVSPGVRTRHLESPEEIQMYLVIVYIYTVQCTKYTCICICWATCRSLD